MVSSLRSISYAIFLLGLLGALTSTQEIVTNDAMPRLGSITTSSQVIVTNSTSTSTTTPKKTSSGFCEQDMFKSIIFCWFHQAPVWQRTCILVATVCASFAVALSCTHITRHLFQRRTHPSFKALTLKITVMVPLYTLDALFILLDARSIYYIPLLFTAFREAYEAFVLLAFTQMVFVTLKGPQEVAIQFCRSMQRPQTPFLSRIPTPFKPGLPYVAGVLVGIFQFCLLMSLVTVANIVVFVLLNTGAESFEKMATYRSVLNGIKSVSVTIAMYCLTVLYFEIQRNEALQEAFHRLKYAEGKFLCIKGIIMFTIFQNFLCQLLERLGVFDKVHLATPRSSSSLQSEKADVGLALDNFALCCEMVVFSIAHVLAYPVHEHDGSRVPEQAIGVKGLCADTLSICRKAYTQRKLVKKMCANEGLTEEECKLLFDTFDHEHRGVITRLQFEYLMECIHRSWAQTRLRDQAIATHNVTSNFDEISFDEFSVSLQSSGMAPRSHTRSGILLSTVSN